MPNVLLTRQEITFEALDVLENMLSFTKHVTREYDDRFGVDGAKIGYTLNLRKPARSLGSTGQALQTEDFIERSVPLTLNKQYQESLAFTSSDLALSLDDFSQRVIKPRVVNLANRIDFDGMQRFVDVFNEVGTPGTPPTSADTYLNAEQLLQNEAAPQDDTWTLHISPQQNRSIFPQLQGLLSNTGFLQALVAKRQIEYEKGIIGKALSFTWFVDQNAPLQTVGAFGATTGTVTGGGQTGSSLITAGWSVAAPVFNVGDIITIAGVFAINPLNRQSTGLLRQFVVTALTTGAGNAATIPIACVDGDGITTSGPYQTVTNSPAGGAVVTVNGAQNTSSLRGLAFHPLAFTFADADLPLYEGQHISERAADKQLGLSIRLWGQPDINTDRLIVRMDLLGGWVTMYPQVAVRIAS